MKSKEIARKMNPSLNTILFVIMSFVLLVSGFRMEAFELNFGVGLHSAMLVATMLVLAIDFFVVIFHFFPRVWNAIKWVVLSIVLVTITIGGKLY